MDNINKRANQWIVGNDTGVSSKTIWAVMVGVEIDTPRSWKWGTPGDPSDFGRCYRLLALIPEWQQRLREVSNIFPAWQPLVDNWQELATLWELESPSERCPRLYDRMQQLSEEGKRLDGWQETSPGCWKREAE